MKKILLAFYLCLAALGAQAQNPVLDSATLREHLEKTVYDIDPDASAVVLYAQAHYTLYRDVYQYKEDLVVKVLKADAAKKDLSTFSRKIGKQFSLKHMELQTFNMVDGQVVMLRSDTALKTNTEQPSQIYKQLPNHLKEGSILYLQLTVDLAKKTAKRLTWAFQREYPTLYSELIFTSSQAVAYTTVRALVEPFTVVKDESRLNDPQLTSVNFKFTTKGPAPNRERWVRKNVPAYIPEELSGPSIANIEKVTILLKEVADQGYIYTYYLNWGEWMEALKKQPESAYLFDLYKKRPVLRNYITQISSEYDNDQDRAKAIFRFVRDSFEVDYNSQRLDIDRVFLKRKGSPRELNALLVALYNQMGWISAPMLVSSDDDEGLTPLYIDHSLDMALLCHLNLSGKDYFLDASTKLPFNVLPRNYYNGHGMILSSNGKQYKMSRSIVPEKESILWTQHWSIDSATLKNHLSLQCAPYLSYYLRSEYKKDSSLIYKYIINRFAGILDGQEPQNVQMKHTGAIDFPFTLSFESVRKWDTSVNQLLLAPLNHFFVQKNPLKSSSTRYYPIIWDNNVDLSAHIRIHLPQHMALDESPPSVWLKMGLSDDFSFKVVSNYDSAEHVYAMQARYVRKETEYPLGQYEDIRAFFEKFIEEQNKGILVNKK